MPKVSVIIPNYNHAPFLKQRIESVLNQSFQDFELILLDDCSSDNSRQVMDGYCNHSKVTHVVYNSQNSGSAFRQWKKGIDLAVGEWLWIAESDDWAENTFLETMLQVVAQDSHCVLGSSLPGYVYPDGNTWHKECNGGVRVYQGCEFVRQRLARGNALSNVSALLIRRDTVGQLDFSTASNMHLCGDWLIYAMLCEKGSIVEYGGVLSYFRQHGDNTSSEADREGLSFIEGVQVLDYLTQTFKISSKVYAREWGRSWAKKERQHQFSKDLKTLICHSMRNYPSIRFWHNVYQIRLWLK